MAACRFRQVALAQPFAGTPAPSCKWATTSKQEEAKIEESVAARIPQAQAHVYKANPATKLSKKCRFIESRALLVTPRVIITATAASDSHHPCSLSVHPPKHERSSSSSASSSVASIIIVITAAVEWLVVPSMLLLLPPAPTVCCAHSGYTVSDFLLQQSPIADVLMRSTPTARGQSAALKLPRAQPKRIALCTQEFAVLMIHQRALLLALLSALSACALVAASKGSAVSVCGAFCAVAIPRNSHHPGGGFECRNLRKRHQTCAHSFWYAPPINPPVSLFC